MLRWIGHDLGARPRRGPGRVRAPTVHRVERHCTRCGVSAVSARPLPAPARDVPPQTRLPQGCRLPTIDVIALCTRGRDSAGGGLCWGPGGVGRRGAAGSGAIVVIVLVTSRSGAARLSVWSGAELRRARRWSQTRRAAHRAMEGLVDPAWRVIPRPPIPPAAGGRRQLVDEHDLRPGGVPRRRRPEVRAATRRGPHDAIVPGSPSARSSTGASSCARHAPAGRARPACGARRYPAGAAHPTSWRRGDGDHQAPSKTARPPRIACAERRGPARSTSRSAARAPSPRSAVM